MAGAVDLAIHQCDEHRVQTAELLVHDRPADSAILRNAVDCDCVKAFGVHDDATRIEHLFLSPRREVRKADARIVALFDTGPAQLGAPRLVQIALWILLARRAEAAGLEFRWGTLAEQNTQLFRLERSTRRDRADAVIVGYLPSQGSRGGDYRIVDLSAPSAGPVVAGSAGSPPQGAPGDPGAAAGLADLLSIPMTFGCTVMTAPLRILRCPGSGGFSRDLPPEPGTLSRKHHDRF